MIFPGVYRARAVKLDGTALTTYVPQIFGDTSISVVDVAGTFPATFPSMGWVAFHAGVAENPVWLGAATTGGGGTVTDTLWVGTDAPTDAAIELWYDTDEPTPVSTVVTGSRGGNAALTSLLLVLQNLGLITDSTT